MTAVVTLSKQHTGNALTTPNVRTPSRCRAWEPKTHHRDAEAPGGRSGRLQHRDEFRKKCLLGKERAGAGWRVGTGRGGFLPEPLNLPHHLVHLAVGSHCAKRLVADGVQDFGYVAGLRANIEDRRRDT